LKKKLKRLNYHNQNETNKNKKFRLHRQQRQITLLWWSCQKEWRL
jgi:hypothetical protein